MCGIAGILSFAGKKVELSQLKQMTDAIIHRGPDGEGHWVNGRGNIGLGHRRLSILDLSLQGSQPMHYLDSRYSITFNGEIYNYIELRLDLKKRGYVFRSESDTEVILALYDLYREKCLAHLDGMFAFAIWDEVDNSLFCARDRFGEKPFHYYQAKDFFYFASEIKQFKSVNLPATIDKQRMTAFIAHGIVESDESLTQTFFREIQKLDAAHYLLIRPNKSTHIRRYWEINSNDKEFEGSIEEARSIFLDLLKESVLLRMRSDVPVGSSLSGGLDSSAIVKIIDEFGLKKGSQNTFSARFKNFSKDEGTHILNVINSCRNVKDYYTWPDEDYLSKVLDDIIFYQDEPFSSASIVAQYAVMALAKENGVTVLLDGQGADEQLGGYLPYYSIYLDELRRKKDTNFLKELESYSRFHSAAEPYSSVFETETFRMRMGRQRRKLFYRSKEDPLSLRARLRHDTCINGLKELLRYADRNSMAHSREVRLPFLSHKLVEFVFTLPSSYLLNSGWTKFILRKSMNDFLPSSICWRVDKIGYEAPQKKWLSTGSVLQDVQTAKKRFDLGPILSKPHNSNNLDWRIWVASKYI